MHSNPYQVCKSKEVWQLLSRPVATLSIQLASDVHVEFFDSLAQFPVLPVKAPVLVLAGDIGNPQNPTHEQFLLDMASKFERVFLVCGTRNWAFFF